MKHGLRRPRQRGVSLIEALVALAVMAFGILGVVGVQVSLRMNADVSKQRSEAVRIAQQEIERLRTYTALVQTTPPDGQFTYDQIVATTVAEVITSQNTNTSYTLTRGVFDSQGVNPAAPRFRAVRVDVSWQDRTGNQPSVFMVSNIDGVAPELAGSLGIPGDSSVTQVPGGGRNRAIPVAATDQGNGTSTFTPPGSTNVTWTFNNTTAVISQRICNPVCVTNTAFLLSGYIRFASAATPQQAENPTGTPVTLPVPKIGVNNSSPNAPITYGGPVPATVGTSPPSSCYVDPPTVTLPSAPGGYVAYYCAVTVGPSLPLQWSGTWMFAPWPALLAPTQSEVSASLYKVCRYTPVAADTTINGNVDHPLRYVNVTGALTNQNYLMIPAGDGVATPFSCPGDDSSTPLLNGNTYKQQPYS